MACWLRRSPLRENNKKRKLRPSHLPPQTAFARCTNDDESRDELAKAWISALGFDSADLSKRGPASWNKFTTITIMHEACQQGNVFMCQWLWDHGMHDTTNKRNHNRCSPLFWACWHGHLECIRWLVAHGAKRDIREPNKAGWTPMLYAAWHGHLHVVKWLYASGAWEDVRTRATDNGGWTPLYYAAQGGHLEVVEWLYEHGAWSDVALDAKFGGRPLAAACAQGHIQVLAWLIAHGGASTENLPPPPCGLSSGLGISGPAGDWEDAENHDSNTPRAAPSSRRSLCAVAVCAGPQRAPRGVSREVLVRCGLLAPPEQTAAPQPGNPLAVPQAALQAALQAAPAPSVHPNGHHGGGNARSEEPSARLRTRFVDWAAAQEAAHRTFVDAFLPGLLGKGLLGRAQSPSGALAAEEASEPSVEPSAEPGLEPGVDPGRSRRRLGSPGPRPLAVEAGSPRGRVLGRGLAALGRLDEVTRAALLRLIADGAGILYGARRRNVLDAVSLLRDAASPPSPEAGLGAARPQGPAAGAPSDPIVEEDAETDGEGVP